MWVDYGRIIEACLHEILQWFGHVTKILRNKFIFMIMMKGAILIKVPRVSVQISQLSHRVSGKTQG